MIELDKRERYDQVRFLILLMLVGSLPFTFRIGNVLIALSVVLFLGQYTRKRSGENALTRLAWGFTLFFVYEIIGLLYTDSENIRNGFRTLETHLSLILVPLAFTNFEITQARKKMFFYSFVGGCFIASLVCFVENISLSLVEGEFFHEYYFSHDRFSEPIGMQAVYFGLYISFCVLIIVNLLREEFRDLATYRKIMWVVLAMYFVLLAITSGARTTIVVLMFILIVTGVLHAIQTKAYRFIAWSALVPAIFIVLIILNPVVATRFADLRHDQTTGSNYDSYFARTNIWRPGVEAIRESIWFGVGIGDQQNELSKKYKKFNYAEGIEMRFNLHNQYLQTTLASGLVGFLLLMFIFLLQLKKGFAYNDWLYVSFLFLFGCACVTESMFERNKGIVFFLVFSIVLFNQTRGANVQRKKNKADIKLASS